MNVMAEQIGDTGAGGANSKKNVIRTKKSCWFWNGAKQ